ncbi:MAG: glycine zipper family protein [Pseudomonadota bacterium]
MNVLNDSLRRMRPLVCVAFFAVAGCASHPGPIVDTKGVDMAVYKQDLQECELYASEVSVTEGTARGAVVGAAVGGLLGAITGDAAQGAGYGGVSGGARSGLDNKREQERVVKKCMRGRGYKVLN